MKVLAVLIGLLAFVVLFAGGILHAGKRDLDNRAQSWFHIVGGPEFYTRGFRCSAAIYRLSRAEPRGAVSVVHDFAWANRTFDDLGYSAMRFQGFGAGELGNVLDLGGETPLSRGITSALDRGSLCTSRVEGAFNAARARSGAVVLYRASGDTVMILDPVQMRLFVTQAFLS